MSFSTRLMIVFGIMACAGMAWSQQAAPADGAAKPAQADPVTLYVAANGNDEWSGTLDEPKSGGGDGPFATLEGARNALRKMREAGRASGPVTVYVRDGVYTVTQAFTLEPKDGGQAGAPVTYAAYKDEHPVLSGGRKVTGWKQEEKFWVAEMPEVTSTDWRFSSIFVNGERRMRSRTPNEGFFYTAGKAPAGENSTTGEKILSSKNAFQFNPGDLKRWDDMEDALVVVLHAWETSFHHIASIDEQKNIVTLRNAAEWPFENWGPRQRYYVENTFEGLDTPGEWYVNTKTGRLYYLPMPGEDMAKAEVCVPQAKLLLSIEGNPGTRQFVDYVVIDGLGFEYANYPVGPEGLSDIGSAISIPGAIQMRGARFCTLRNCDIRHVDTYGLWMRVGSHSNSITHNLFQDLGAGGIRIGERQRSGDTLDVVHNVIDNNFVHDGGRVYKSGVGIWIGQSAMNTISHNEIADLSNSAVSVGWAWNPQQEFSFSNLVEYNSIHHIGRAEFSNMAGIYVMGGSSNTMIRNNVIHDVLAFQYGGWGVHLDEGSSHCCITDNIVYNTTSGAFDQYYGNFNRLENNIFAFSGESQLSLSEERNGIPVISERNVILTDNGLPFGSNWEYTQVWSNGNCYWDVKGWDMDFRGGTFEEWQKIGNDPFSIMADPLFENAAAGDFRLKEGSPALALGFHPIDASEAGLRGDSKWTGLSGAVVRPDSRVSDTFTPKPVSEDFENVPAGVVPPGATVFGAVGKASVATVEESPAAGKRCLKITDTEGPQEEWQPEMCYTCRFKDGMCVAAYDIKLAKDSFVQHDWRSDWTGRRVGPRLNFKDGQLTVGDSPTSLMDIPADQWVHVEIQCGLGHAAKTPAVFTLIVTVPGQEPKKFEDLKCLYPKFRAAEKYWFLSSAKANTAYYIDNLNIQTK